VHQYKDVLACPPRVRILHSTLLRDSLGLNLPHAHTSTILSR